CRIVSLASAAGESFDELLVRCCAELGIAERATDRLARARLLVNHFIAQIPEGRNTVLVIDAAHNLDEAGPRHLFLLSERDAPELVARLSNQALVITQLEGLRTVTAEAVDQAGHAVFAPPKPDRRPLASVEVPPVTIERPARAVPTSATGDRQRPATATGSA